MGMSETSSINISKLAFADAIPSVITKGYSYDTSGESNLTNWKNQFRLDDITINHSYTMEFMARTEKASTRIQAGLFGVNAAGNVFGSDTIDGSYQIKEFTAQPNWNKYSFTFKFTNVSSKHLSAALGAKNLNPENFSNIGMQTSSVAPG